MEKIENARKTLKVLGIISIVIGALGIIFGIMSMGGGGFLSGSLATSGSTMDQTDVDAAATATGLVIVLGAAVLISGIFTLLLGIFSVRGSNDFSKVGGAFVLGIIDLVINIVGIISGLMAGGGFSSILSSLVSLVFAACIVWAAKTIKDYNAGGGNPGNGQLPPQ